MIGILAFVTLWQVAPPPAGTPFISEDIACAPISLPAPPVPSMRVVGGAEAGRFLFGPGEAVVVNAGTTHGLRTGQQYYVRRYISDRFTPSSLVTSCMSPERPKNSPGLPSRPPPTSLPKAIE